MIRYKLRPSSLAYFTTWDDIDDELMYKSYLDFNIDVFNTSPTLVIL